MKVSDLISRCVPKLVVRGRNLEWIDWIDGYLIVKFRTAPARWIYGPKIPEEEANKLLRVPFPDKLFALNIKAKCKAYKVPVSDTNGDHHDDVLKAL
jgi:hypothetical protein